jgi:hypothetical protein
LDVVSGGNVLFQTTLHARTPTPTFFINGARFDGDWTDAEAFARALEDAAAVASGRSRRETAAADITNT